MLRHLSYLTFFLFGIAAYSQNCISGIVSDDSTQTGLQEVEIYLPELNKSTKTDEQGKFSICNLPRGNFTLQAKHLGYKIFISKASLKDSALTLNIRLHNTATEFPEAVI